MNTILTHDFFLLRRSVLPVDVLEYFNSKSQSGQSEDDLLKEIYSDPVLQEALYIASREFYKIFLQWFKGEKTYDNQKITITLYKYLIRMCTRCTPYGLFAGCTSGVIASYTDIVFDNLRPYRKYSRLDMGYLIEIIRSILAESDIRKQLSFYPNRSLYKVDSTYRYTESRLRDAQYNYFISSIEESDYINDVLKKARHGATISELTYGLVDEHTSIQEVTSFIEDLIDVQLIVPEFTPNITGTDSLDLFVQFLEKKNITSPSIETIKLIRSSFLDSCAEINQYRNIELLANKIIEISGKDVVQVDLFYNTSTNTLNQKVVDRITQQIRKLNVLATAPTLNALEMFKKQFYERYEEQEIPLHIALDDELGVGYDSTKHGIGYQPLTEDIILPNDSKSKRFNWDARNELILQRYFETVRNQDNIIRLTDDDLALFESSGTQQDFPDSFYIFGNLIAASAESIDKQEFQFNLLGCTGPSGASLLGRFCYGEDKLSQKVKEIVYSEEQKNPHAIFAEVVHLPDDRSGNVIKRPILRNYEIPYLCGSLVTDEFQLPVDDLQVSVPGGKRVVLRSSKLNKEIITRMSNAHNFRSGLPIYKFLCDLQFQDIGMNLGWDWGILVKQKYLPRVEYKNIILSRSTWNLSKQDLSAYLKNNYKFRSYLRQTLAIPQNVVIVQADNELLIDIETNLSLHLLIEELSKREFVTLKEPLFLPHQRFLKDTSGTYTNEIIIPLQSKLKSKHILAPNSKSSRHVQRKFPLGSDWLFVKIYAGEKILESMLAQQIPELIQKLFEAKLIDKWFFVRYADPEPHIRLRFHGDSERNFYLDVINILNLLIKEKDQKHIIGRIQYDTYNREIERYGEEIIELCEELFFHDSTNTLKVISLLDGDETEDQRWMFALQGVDALLENAGCNLLEKLAIIEPLYETFFKEFGENSHFRKQLNDKYRKYAQVITNALNGTEVLDITLASSLLYRSECCRPLFDQISALTGKDSVIRILPSLIHLFLNRIFFINQRFHELIIYHFLTKHYHSVKGRNTNLN